MCITLDIENLEIRINNTFYNFFFIATKLQNFYENSKSHVVKI